RSPSVRQYAGSSRLAPRVPPVSDALRRHEELYIKWYNTNTEPIYTGQAHKKAGHVEHNRSVIESPVRRSLPSHVDGGFHVVCQDDEFRRAVVVMGAKTQRCRPWQPQRAENSEKLKGEQDGGTSQNGYCFMAKPGDMQYRRPAKETGQNGAMRKSQVQNVILVVISVCLTMLVLELAVRIHRRLTRSVV